MKTVMLRAGAVAFAALLALPGAASAQTSATNTADWDSQGRDQGSQTDREAADRRRADRDRNNADRRNRDRGVEDHTELAIGWRPSNRRVKIEDEVGNKVVGEDWDLNQWRGELRHPGLFDDAAEAHLLFEYYDKDLEAKKNLPGDFAGHGLTTRAWLAFPIVLGDHDRHERYGRDDDGDHGGGGGDHHHDWHDAHFRLVPEIGANLNSNWGGHGSNVELANHGEYGPMLGMNLVYHGDEDRNRVGAGIQLTYFVDEIHSAQRLGDFEHGEEFRFQAFWSTKVSDSLRIELRYIFTYQQFTFNESEGRLGFPPSGQNAANIWHENDNALAISGVVAF
jgi:hypothetical protein